MDQQPLGGVALRRARIAANGDGREIVCVAEKQRAPVD